MQGPRGVRGYELDVDCATGKSSACAEGRTSHHDAARKLTLRRVLEANVDEARARNLGGVDALA